VAQGNLAVAQSALAQAQTRYALLKNGPDPDQLAAAQQRLAAAQAALVAAKSALGDLDLKASISGTVTVLRIHNGEWVTLGQPVVVLTDLAHLRVETTDLSERDVPQLSVGQSVAVMVKALNQSITGQVTAIAPLADTPGGDVVYKTTIELSTRPADLRAGMSVDVAFGTAP
jgi:multidrug resistance efflux pump